VKTFARDVAIDRLRRHKIVALDQVIADEISDAHSVLNYSRVTIIGRFK
jgi:hypothetical protein